MYDIISQYNEMSEYIGENESAQEQHDIREMESRRYLRYTKLKSIKGFRVPNEGFRIIPNDDDLPFCATRS